LWTGLDWLGYRAAMAKSSRGHIQRLPSGSFRVKVYAGTDPVTGKERLLRQTCLDEAAAQVALGRLLTEADGGRFPDRDATLGQALDRYLEVTDLEVSTREAHEGYIRRTIGPVLGGVKVRKLGPDSLDGLYTALKKCSRLCGRLPKTEHHTEGQHGCDQRCGPLRDHRTGRPHTCDSRCRLHVCKPMRPATILRIHSIISAALDLAVRYEWTDRNVAKNARPPHPRKREPDPPSPEQAARLLNLVWAEDEEFGLYLWTAFTTGARRGEVTALRENRFDFTRQQRCVRAGRCVRVLPDPAGRTPWNPDTMTHRYRRYARRVGIASSLKELRHYSATQLLTAGTDLNTVAGRLGHAEGSTTLKFYAQFTRPADQRAAAVIPAQLDGLRKRERLRDLYRQAPSSNDLGHLASTLGPLTGLDLETALGFLTEFAAQP
jgi:integrase